MSANAVDIHALSGAYALDSIDDLERVAFERHLRDCPSCAEEVRELRATAARLADDVAVTPPAGLRANVLAAVAQTPQVRTARPAREQTSAVTRWRRWAAASVAAAVVAVGIGVGTWTIAQGRIHAAERQVAAQHRRAADIERVLSAPDARLLRTAARDGGTVTLIVSPGQDAAVASLRGMPRLPAGKTYQLWKINGDVATSAGTIPADAVVPIKELSSAKAFGVSIEPAGGSTQPTKDQIIGILAV
jgi:anti-sigma-K factor RskA